MSTSSPTVGVVVVAAGSGTRLGHAEPKAFVHLAGRSILEHALDRIFALRDEAQVVVVAPASHRDAAERIAHRAAGVAHASVSVVIGGASRRESVAAGVAALDDDIEVVLIHDAARALTPVEVFERVIEGVRTLNVGVVPVLPLVDTVLQRASEGEVLALVDRDQLSRAQTPQGFPLKPFRDALASSAGEHTDDTSVFIASGRRVVTVAGDEQAAKVTTPWDLRRAELSLAAQRPPVRTGIGVDVHAYDEASPLWLGGLYWPDEPGLAGHSDGDAVCHAVCDALLSAAGLGDIGSRFGVDDPAFADARGTVFLEATRDLVREAGFEVINVAVQIVAARPRFAPRRHEVEALLTRLLDAPVSVAATTSDGLGFTGRAEGVTAIATALVRS